MDKTKIFKRLYSDYSKKYLNKIFLSGLLSVLVAGSTSAIAWLLDPAIEKIFICMLFIFIIFPTDRRLRNGISSKLLFAFYNSIYSLIYLSNENI